MSSRIVPTAQIPLQSDRRGQSGWGWWRRSVLSRSGTKSTIARSGATRSASASATGASAVKKRPRRTLPIQSVVASRLISNLISADLGLVLRPGPVAANHSAGCGEGSPSPTCRGSSRSPRIGDRVDPADLLRSALVAAPGRWCSCTCRPPPPSLVGRHGRRCTGRASSPAPHPLKERSRRPVSEVRGDLLGQLLHQLHLSVVLEGREVAAGGELDR